MGVVEEGPGAIVRSEGTKRRSTLLDIYNHICIRRCLVMGGCGSSRSTSKFISLEGTEN